MEPVEVRTAHCDDSNVAFGLPDLASWHMSGMQVDLIVCFDSDASPIRNIQRMGRTGRHKAGSVVYIMAKGKEEESYKKGLQVTVPPQKAPACFLACASMLV